jgi:hypothetical protein
MINLKIKQSLIWTCCCYIHQPAKKQERVAQIRITSRCIHTNIKKQTRLDSHCNVIYYSSLIFHYSLCKVLFSVLQVFFFHFSSQSWFFIQFYPHKIPFCCSRFSHALWVAFNHVSWLLRIISGLNSFWTLNEKF